VRTGTQLEELHRPPGRHRSGQPQGGSVPDHRQLVESQQPGDADLDGSASAPASRLHPDRGVLAQPAGGLVAAVQTRGLRGAELCQPQRDRSGAGSRHQTAQPPSQALGLGTAPQGAAPSETTLLLSHLRNVALTLVDQVRHRFCSQRWGRMVGGKHSVLGWRCSDAHSPQADGANCRGE
jgi:hypothetical protein